MDDDTTIKTRIHFQAFISGEPLACLVRERREGNGEGIEEERPRISGRGLQAEAGSRSLRLRGLSKVNIPVLFLGARQNTRLDKSIPGKYSEPVKLFMAPLTLGNWSPTVMCREGFYAW